MSAYVNSSCTIALDVGGTKIAAAFIPDDAPKDVHRVPTRPTQAHEGATCVVKNIRAAIDEAIDAAKAQGYIPGAMCIAAPGVINPEGVVTAASDTMPGWAGTDIYGSCASHYDIPIVVHNDVRVMGLGETLYGGNYSGTVLFISIGTGIGGAFVVDGKLSQHASGVRGEIGYLLAPDCEGYARPIEKIGSGPAIERTYARIHQLEKPVSLRELMASEHKDEAMKVFHDSLYCVGQGIASLVNVLGVDHLVLGGGVGTLEQAVEPFSQGFLSSALDPVAGISISQASLGTDAPLVGAGHLARALLNK